MPETELSLGAPRAGVDYMICPELTEWISKQLEKEATIAKQTRKAGEERALARKR